MICGPELMTCNIIKMCFYIGHFREGRVEAEGRRWDGCLLINGLLTLVTLKTVRVCVL
jgi:hypothetical protein